MFCKFCIRRLSWKEAIALKETDMVLKWGHVYGARRKVFKLKRKLKGKKQLVLERVDVTKWFPPQLFSLPLKEIVSF